MTNSVSHAYFDNYAQASRAINDLEAAGVDRDNISVFGHKDGEVVNADGNTPTEEATKDIAGKAALGSGVGALLGVGALAIPGVGPFVAAGAIAEAAVGGAALAGTAAGAAAGGIAGALQDHGIPEDESNFYSEKLKRGGVLVTVNEDDDNKVRRYNDVLYRDGGYTVSNAQAA